MNVILSIIAEAIIYYPLSIFLPYDKAKKLARESLWLERIESQSATSFQQLCGQTLPHQAAIAAVKNDFDRSEDDPPRKPLILDFAGSSGPGKTFLAESIILPHFIECSGSKSTRSYIGPDHFPDTEPESSHKDKIRTEVLEQVRQFLQSLFLFDKTGKLSPSILNDSSFYLDARAECKGVDNPPRKPLVLVGSHVVGKTFSAGSFIRPHFIKWFFWFNKNSGENLKTVPSTSLVQVDNLISMSNKNFDEELENLLFEFELNDENILPAIKTAVKPTLECVPPKRPGIILVLNYVNENGQMFVEKLSRLINEQFDTQTMAKTIDFEEESIGWYENVKSYLTSKNGGKAVIIYNADKIKNKQHLISFHNLCDNDHALDKRATIIFLFQEGIRNFERDQQNSQIVNNLLNLVWDFYDEDERTSLIARISGNVIKI